MFLNMNFCMRGPAEEILRERCAVAQIGAPIIEISSRARHCICRYIERHSIHAASGPLRTGADVLRST
jgi:hypothetical protein